MLACAITTDTLLLQEEAVHTYTTLLKEIDSGALPMFEHLGAPLLAIDYWKLPTDANFRDLILAVRADEANHRVVSYYQPLCTLAVHTLSILSHYCISMYTVVSFLDILLSNAHDVCLLACVYLLQLLLL
jgi:Alternative oxidase